ncbi:MAG TPA: PD-(D/E)XK nuclease family protein [Woeseiaceae bacterium]|nr:PD-(D/E)XK nuclease family protein [Woeseiaceae bacterium]
MYEWLSETLAKEETQIVSANRRLARTLRQAYAEQQIAAGLDAWRSPAIHAWRDWLQLLLERHDNSSTLPLVITDQQSRVLWENNLRVVLDDPFVNFASLARQCRDTWQRLCEWRVPLANCRQVARGMDQQMFARAAEGYQQSLRRHGWIDAALVPDLLATLSDARALNLPRHVILLGFDRLTPQIDALLLSLGDTVCTQVKEATRKTAVPSLLLFDSPDAELRAAGSWARAELKENPQQKLAVVVGGLEQDAERVGALIREGMVPGWQHAAPGAAAAVNVSYGKRLAAFPAIHIALSVLRWLYSDLRSVDVSLLLRSPFLGNMPVAGRSRLELALRELPDQQWSRELALAALRGRDPTADAENWLACLDAIGALVAEAEARMRPASWADLFARALKIFNWPGDAVLSSGDFQLDNRWRGLLNEFASLELVCPSMTGIEAVTRLAGLAGETVFQPETEGAVLHVIGPLEAAGMEFDQLWIGGATATSWPPPARPLPLVSRQLQIEYGMPDSSPADTAEHAGRVLDRLQRSASRCIFSYPGHIGDAEQLPTSLLRDVSADGDRPDPGWYAERFAGGMDVIEVRDRVPVVTADEVLTGGATLIDLQAADPFAAFAYGRLAVRWISAFKAGLPALLRGNLVHSALFHLYRERPKRAQIAAWTDGQIELRIANAVQAAFAPQERYADRLLLQLLNLEKRRTADLLQRVLEVDKSRTDFAVGGLEVTLDRLVGFLRLKLRVDRIDTCSAGDIILDYKTGAGKKFLVKGEPKEWQLLVYSIALGRNVAALGLFNVDSRLTEIDGAGPGLAQTESDAEWDNTVLRWQDEVLRLAAEIARGDVRLNIRQAPADARPLALLSRYAELQHAD